LNQAHQSWKREKQRVAEQASPPDSAALARQQYLTADANVQNAIAGTGRGPTGIYSVETKLRSLLGLPVADGTLVWPTDRPLEADLRFDWHESLQVAHTRRLELRKQQAEVHKRNLELKAARNFQQPQVDLVGKYGRLADDPDDGNALFSEALQGWRLGIEVRRALGNRRETAAVRNAELRLSRDYAVLNEQQSQISSQLRNAFTELDRAYGVTQLLAASREAAEIRLRAEANRHAAGDTQIERVLESQIRSTLAETSFLRSLVDYNLAFIKVHLARGTLLDTFRVGFSEHATAEQIQFAQRAPSVFANSKQSAPKPSLREPKDRASQRFSRLP
tara:strand:+ start:457 stop:1458 length:1002 start_codon:yes stop_codon:yes gene_type:complete